MSGVLTGVPQAKSGWESLLGGDDGHANLGHKQIARQGRTRRDEGEGNLDLGRAHGKFLQKRM